MATSPLRIQFSISTRLRTRRCWREYHCSFYNIAVTLVVHLYSVVMAGKTCRASLYSFDFGGVAFDGVVPH